MPKKNRRGGRSGGHEALEAVAAAMAAAAGLVPLDDSLIDKLVLSGGYKRADLLELKASGFRYSTARNSFVSPYTIDFD
jgi:hypothetical protein